MSETVRFIIAAILFTAGAASVILGVIGVFKFKYVMNRMHSAAIIDAAGVFFILCGLAVISGSMEYIPKLVLVLILLWIGSPIASHMVGRLEIRTDTEAVDFMDTREADSDTLSREQEVTPQDNTGNNGRKES